MKGISVMKGDGSFALACPDYVNTAVFSTAGSTARDILISSQATHVFLSGDCNFVARYNNAPSSTPAAYPSSSLGTSDGSACELNPTVRYVSKGQIGAISVISPTSGVVTCAQFNSGST